MRKGMYTLVKLPAVLPNQALLRIFCSKRDAKEAGTNSSSIYIDIYIKKE